MSAVLLFSFFFFNDTATTEIYTLSLHDALPISVRRDGYGGGGDTGRGGGSGAARASRWRPWSASRPGPASSASASRDRKSTRLNSSHGYISYAVFCLKKKKNQHRWRDDNLASGL